MEALGLLEKKIKNLVELIGKLKDENAKLKTENSRLKDENIKLLSKIEDVERTMESTKGSILEQGKNLEELSQEKELTKIVVDDLIKSIDSFVQEN